MEVNLVAVLAATVVMFAVGAFWFTVVFGKAWGDIHGFDKLSKKEQDAMSKQMGPWYGLQTLMTFVSAYVIALLMSLMPNESPYFIAFLAWVGFALPTEVGAQIFGGAPKGFVWHKIGIAGAELLIRFLAAAWIISLFA